MSDTHTFDAFIGQAWTDHAGDAAGVAERIATQGLALVGTAAQIGPLAMLAHHVYGEHLGQWAAGRAMLDRLASHGAIDAAGIGAVRRCQASLDLCTGGAMPVDMNASDRIRVAALAAGNLAERDTPRAMALFEQALAEAAAAALPDTDPMNRNLAIAGNNLACTMEEKPQRSAAERELMIRAAQAARHHWAIAGTWLETERAEYRLAMTWLQAGDLAQARRHAHECGAIVQANQGAALERFFAGEALGVVERAAGNAGGHRQALAQAREAFAALDEGDRAWCQASLDKLAA